MDNPTRKMSRHRFSFLVCLVIVAMLNAINIEVTSAASETENIQGSAENIVWIDVRSWAEHQFDSIEGDTQIHFSEIVDGVSQLYPNKDTAIKLYCAVGGRAEKALNSLKSAGYTNIVNAGGIDQVRAIRKLPIE